MRISEPLALLAIMIAAAATASAQSPLDQLKTYTESTPPPAKASTPAAGSGRSAAISLGAAVGKYDIVGIKLDIPLKEALAALKAHSPNFRLQPDSIKYAVLPYALTYGISAVNPSMVNYQDGRLIPPDTEKFYFMIAMPPSQDIVTKVSRLMTFSKDTAPIGDVMVADLEKKYGAPSWDTRPSSLNGMGARDIFWVDDQDGNRLRLENAAAYQCASWSTFHLAVADTERALNGYQATDLRIDPVRAKLRIEQGFVNQMDNARECANYTMIRVRLFDTRSIGISTPNLVGGLLVMMASGPLDRKATEATHEYLIQASKARDASQTDAAKQNRPKL